MRARIISCFHSEETRPTVGAEEGRENAEKAVQQAIVAMVKKIKLTTMSEDRKTALLAAIKKTISRWDGHIPEGTSVELEEEGAPPAMKKART